MTMTAQAPVVGLTEAAELLGLTKQTLQTIRGRDNMTRRAESNHRRVLLPEPDYVVSGNPVWLPATIVEYGKETGRIARTVDDELARDAGQ